MFQLMSAFPSLVEPIEKGKPGDQRSDVEVERTLVAVLSEIREELGPVKCQKSKPRQSPGGGF
jgi:hypothetical protein